MLRLRPPKERGGLRSEAVTFCIGASPQRDLPSRVPWACGPPKWMKNGVLAVARLSRATGCGATGRPGSDCRSSGPDAGPAGLEKMCKIRFWRKRHRCPEKCARADARQTTGETSAYIFLHPKNCRKLGESNFSHLLETRATDGSRKCFSKRAERGICCFRVPHMSLRVQEKADLSLRSG
jgi:hypothetical protein